jgi:hypothetical protein
MDNVKITLGSVAVLLAIIGYMPYIRDVLGGRTEHHVYTWFILGLETSIAYGLQVTSGAGAGSWVTLVGAIACIFIFFLGIRNGKKDITKLDSCFLFCPWSPYSYG